MDNNQNSVTKRIIKIAGQDVEVTYRLEPNTHNRYFNNNKSRPFNKKNFDKRKDSRDRNIITEKTNDGHVNEVTYLNNNYNVNDYLNNNGNTSTCNSEKSELNSAINNLEHVQTDEDHHQKEQQLHQISEQQREKNKRERNKLFEEKIAAKLIKPGIRVCNRFQQLNSNDEETDSERNVTTTTTTNKRKNKKHKKTTLTTGKIITESPLPTPVETTEKLEIPPIVTKELSSINDNNELDNNHLNNYTRMNTIKSKIINDKQKLITPSIDNTPKLNVIDVKDPVKEKRTKRERKLSRTDDNEMQIKNSDNINIMNDCTSKWKQYSSFIQKVLLIILLTFILVFISIKFILHYFCPCESNINLPFPQLFTFR